MGRQETADSDGLSAKQELAALSLAAGASIRAAAKNAEAGERTLHTWLDDPAFKARVAQLRAEILDQAVGGLAVGTSKATATLLKLLDDESAGIRLRAAQAVLDSAIRFRDAAEMDARLQALEDMSRGGRK